MLSILAIGYIVYWAFVGLASAASPSRSTVTHMARALCIALPVAVSRSHDVWDSFTCRPKSFDPLAGSWEYSIWATEHIHGQLKRWYVVMLPDGTILDFVRVFAPFSTGGLKA